VLEVDTSTYHYKSHRSDQAGLEARIKEICATRVRYGYRRAHVVLQREGWNVNIKKVYRIYKELGLQLRNKTPKRRVKARVPMVSLRQDGLDHFDNHHTADDTLDKIDPKQLDQAVAVWSAFTYLAAASGVDFRSLAPMAKWPPPRLCITMNSGIV
jgi:hypothetical protein